MSKSSRPKRHPSTPVTSQGVRDLNGLGPKKPKAEPDVYTYPKALNAPTKVIAE